MDNSSLRNVRDCVQRICESRDELIESYLIEPKIDRSLYQTIANSTVLQLQAMMKTSEITSEQIVQVLIYQCCTIGKKLNAITEPQFTEALLLAQRTTDETQPLHGIPISIKDELNQTDSYSTCGIMRNTLPRNYVKEDSGVLQLLRESGAIPFVRSNVPQAVLASETDNHIFGRTQNPYHYQFTCGGSSGGEAALIAGRCSCIGIGTDIAGSVRIPAHFCGIYAFRPTPTRTTLQGIVTNSLTEEGQHLVIAAPGPLARCVDDLALVLKVWWPSFSDASYTPITGTVASSSFSSSSSIQQSIGEAGTPSPLPSHRVPSSIPRGLWDIDPRVPPLPFHTAHYESNQPLRIGYFMYDQFFTPSVSIQRSVRLAASLLEKQGHSVIPWDPLEKAGINLREAVLAYGILINKDMVQDVIENQLQGYEPLHRLYRSFLALASIPDRFGIRKLVAWIYQYIFRYPRIADIIRCTGSFTLSDAYRWNAQRNRLCEQLLHAMAKDGIDILLCPTVGLPAWPHGYMNYLEPATSYSWIWNYFALPAGVVPVAFTERNEHSRQPYRTTVNTVYERHDPITKFTHATLEELDQAVLNSGQAFPLAVQLVGRPYKDEVVLKGMKSLEQAVALYEPITAERLRKGPPHTLPFPVHEPSSPLYVYD